MQFGTISIESLGMATESLSSHLIVALETIAVSQTTEDHWGSHPSGDGFPTRWLVFPRYFSVSSVGVPSLFVHRSDAQHYERAGRNTSAK